MRKRRRPANHWEEEKGLPTFDHGEEEKGPPAPGHGVEGKGPLPPAMGKRRKATGHGEEGGGALGAAHRRWRRVGWHIRGGSSGSGTSGPEACRVAELWGRLVGEGPGWVNAEQYGGQGLGIEDEGMQV